MSTSRPNHKPGSRRDRFVPDKIEAYTAPADTTLLPFLLRAMPQRRRTNVKELLAHGQVAVCGTPTRQFDQPLKAGDRVEVNLVRAFHVFSHPRLSLVYEDDDVIVVNKGYGLLSVSTDKIREGTAYSIVRDYVKWHNPSAKVFIVHRLDRHTSGLMMFAKTVEAKETMQHNWANMVLERKYVAVVEGVPSPAEGTVKSRLAENSQHIVYSTDDPALGRPAVTRYRTVGSAAGYALLEVELDTGRKNQIRVHMKDIGHPIAGDRKYGAKSSPIRRLALHAMSLRFVHPVTRREMSFATPVPPQMAKMVR